MSAKFDYFDHDSSSDISLEEERFELLSAYIDGEVTIDEKKQVETWLDEDKSFQKLYKDLLTLNQGFQNLHVPIVNQSPQEITNKVFERMEKKRFSKMAFWGGTAIAAIVVASISFFLPDNNYIPQIAEETNTPVENSIPIASNEETNEASLMIAVNRSVVPIPKAPMTSEENK